VKSLQWSWKVAEYCIILSNLRVFIVL